MPFIPLVPQLPNNLGLNVPAYTQAFRVTAAQMRTLNTVPLTLVPAPGPHVALFPQWCLMAYQPAYPLVPFSGSFTIKYVLATDPNGGGSFAAFNDFVSIDGTEPVLMLQTIVPIDNSVYATTDLLSGFDGWIGLPLMLTSNTDVTDGGGTLTLYVNYLRVDLTGITAARVTFSIGALDQAQSIFQITSGAAAADLQFFPAGAAIFVFGSTGNDGAYTVIASEWLEDVVLAIVAVNQGAKTFTVAGNHVAAFVVGTTATVADSTGNDGGYTIVSAVFGGVNTVITVVEAIPDATADGTISNTGNPALSIFVSETIPDSTADGTIIVPA